MGGFTIPNSSTVQPAQVAYRSVTLSVNTTLVWPNQSVGPNDFAARVMNVTATAGSLTLALPPSNQVSTGFDLIISNVGGNSFNLLGNTGVVLATITPGQRYYFNLTDNTTAAGQWDQFLFGAGNSSLSAASVANQSYDIIAIGQYLHQNYPVVSTGASPITVNSDSVTNRGTVYEWTGGGGVLNLPTAASVGNGFFFGIINWGTGALTITPQGGDLVDTVATQPIQPGNSCFVFAGAAGSWFTLGRGLLSNFNFTEAVIAITGGTLVETNTQAANVIQKFTGTLLSNQIVTFPAMVQLYYVQNATSGAFNITFGAAGGGTTVVVPQGFNMVLFSDGTNVVNASNSPIGTATSLQLAPGTAAAPSLSFLGDVQTGIFQPVAATVAVTISGTERARFAAASLTAPAFIPTTATVPTNGMYLPAANTLGFATNSAQVGSVNSTGNWVFNTPASGTALTVNGVAGSDVADFLGNFNGNAQLTLQQSNAGAAASAQFSITSNNGAVNCQMSSTAAGGTASLYYTGTNVFNIYTSGATALNLGTNNNASRVSIGSAGNVTIAAPTSGNGLSLGGSASASLNLDGGINVTSGYTATISLTDTAVKFLTNTSSRPFAFLGNWATATIPAVATTAIYGTPSITTFTNNTALGCLIGGSTASTDYSGIDFTGNNQSTPIGRIALIATGSGSLMKLGTSNNFANGITNTAITIGTTGAVTLGVATSTGYGTPTGNVKTSNFPGATATLLQTSEMVAQLIIDLKTFGVLGA